MASFWRSLRGQSSLTSKPSSTEEESGCGVEYWSEPERSGWLMKQGEYIKTWRRRWFVLKEGNLFWFRDSNVSRATKPRGVIPVASFLTVKSAEDLLHHRRFAFELSTKIERMYFIVDSEKEREDWINSIGRSIVKCSKSATEGEIVDYDWHRNQD